MTAPSPPFSDPPSGVSLRYVETLVGARRAARLLRTLGEPGPKGPDTRLGFLTAWKVLNANVELSGDEGHGVSPAPVPLGNFELLVASLMQGASLGDGLQRMAAGARILRPDLEVAVSSHNGRLTLSVGLAGDPDVGREIYAEALVVALHCAMRWGLERPLTPWRLRSAAAAGELGGSLLDVIGLPVQRCGHGVTVVYARHDAEAPFQTHAFARWHDAAFAEYGKLVNALDASRAARDPAATDIERAVRACLLEGCRTQPEVARRLATSTPTLRRRLAERGASFRDIVVGLKRDAAEVLLLGDKPMDDIAAELGMSDSRCFRRACRAWFGGPPSDVRRSLRGDRMQGAH